MISNSKEWARARGLLYKSEVHGAEEWKIPTEKEFELLNRRGSAMKLTQRLDMEDCVTNEYMVFYLLSFRDTIMHIYICIYTYISIYIYMYIGVYYSILPDLSIFPAVYQSLDIYLFIYLYIHVFLYTYVYVHVILVCIHAMCLCVSIYIYRSMYIYIYM